MAPPSMVTPSHSLVIQYHNQDTPLLNLVTMLLNPATRFHSPRGTLCHPTP